MTCLNNTCGWFYELSTVVCKHIMEDTDMSDRPKEKDRVRSSSDSGEHFGHSIEDDGVSSRSNKKHKDCH